MVNGERVSQDEIFQLQLLVNEEELFKLSNKDAKKYLTKVIEQKHQQRPGHTSQMTTGDFRLMSESPEFDRAGESQMVGGRFRPGQTKDARELTMDFIRAD